MRRIQRQKQQQGLVQHRLTNSTVLVPQLHHHQNQLTVSKKLIRDLSHFLPMKTQNQIFRFESTE
jgi:hypothetical protein